MPVLTSLYLCNSTVYAAVGSPTANGAKITAACQTELPEGCLINGIITNEAELTAALQGFFAANELPTQRVALAAGGSQFNHRVLTLPRMSEKKRAAVLTREFSTGRRRRDRPAGRLHAAFHRQKDQGRHGAGHPRRERGDRNLHQPGRSLRAEAVQHRPGAGRADQAGARHPGACRQELCSAQFDGDSLIAGLYEKGQYKYSTRSRLFNPRGTEASGTEIGARSFPV